MPLYEYRCGQCGHEIEILRKVSDPSPVECPSCHTVGMHKKVTAAGFQLKGTGWYATDFRNSGSGAARADKSGEDAAAAKPAEGAPAGAADGAAATPAPAQGPANAGSAPAAAAPATTPSTGNAA